MNSTNSTNQHSSRTHFETVHKHITDKNTKHTGKSGLLKIKCLTFHILDIINIVEIILRNCCITDDTHAATYCLIIRTQRTQISGRNSNGTKHSGSPEDGREERPKHVGFYTYKHVFNISLVLNVEVIVLKSEKCMSWIV